MAMRPTFLLMLLLGVVSSSQAQSDFRLSTGGMPSLEDAIAPLPPPLGEVAVRERLDSKPEAGPKADEVLKQVVNGLKTRQFEAALPRLEYLQSMRPSEPDLLILRGCVYAESGHPDVAEGIFRKAILISPSHPWARLNLAEAQLSQKKFAEAEATLALLSSTRPESEVVRFKLIMAQVLQKKIPAAEQELQYLRDHATTPAYYFARASMAFAAGEAERGKDFISQAKQSYGEGQTTYFYNSLVAQNWVPKLP